MNYYPHHIGDYASATAHLSMLEDCAYRRLLDWYYLDEKPLPIDSRAIYRRVRAASEMEREAVDVVLAEFFVSAEDGYRHKRCDAEIAASKVKSDARRGAANSRWKGRHMQEAPTAQCTSDANARGQHAIASAVDAIAMHSQEPIAKSQEPIAKERKRSARPSDVPRPDEVPEEVWESWRQVRKAKGGGPVTPIALAGVRREAATADLTLSEALTASCEYSWVGFNAAWYAERQSAGQRLRPTQHSPPLNPERDRNRRLAAALTGYGDPGEIDEYPERKRLG